MVGPTYSADITAGSLKIAESRVVAGLLLQGLGGEGLRESLLKDNALQARSPGTASRIGRLLRKRLEPWDAELWGMIHDGPAALAAQCSLAAAIKSSLLLGDFLDLVVREQYRVFTPALSNKLWDAYLADCRGRDASLPEWNESTQRRLRSTVFQILSQAGYLADTRTLRLQQVALEPKLVAYLYRRNEDYVLRCMQICP